MLRKLTAVFLILFFIAGSAQALPRNFVYLKDIAPSILQDMRYAGYHNFIGHPLPGYQAKECILTKPAALALKQVQVELARSKLRLKVFDCYRPQGAVDFFIQWSKQPKQQTMKAEFYPNVNKRDFFKLGYVAVRSGHTRGSTVDLTIVPIPTLQQASYHRGDKLTSCIAPYHKRYFDSGIDMGTGYDCMDERAHALTQKVSLIAQGNRRLLRVVMMRHGFVPYSKEWWHFTLHNEPYPKTYFNFPVVAQKVK